MHNRRRANIVLLGIILTALLTGCAHRPAYRDPYFFETLGSDSQLMVTMRNDALHNVVVYAFPEFGGEESEILFDRADRISVAVPTTPGDHPVGLYGGVEGRIPKVLTRLGLNASHEWNRTRDGFTYYRSDESGFELAVPKRGIIVFADRNLHEVYDRMTEHRVVYVPRELTQQFLDADAALYSASPDGMNLFGEQVSFPFELFFDEMWVTVNRVDQVVNLNGDHVPERSLYHVAGIITLPENVQARVFDRVIRVLYQDYMKKRDMTVENWRITINLRENRVVFDNFLIFDDIIEQVLRLAAR